MQGWQLWVRRTLLLSHAHKPKCVLRFVFKKERDCGILIMEGQTPHLQGGLENDQSQERPPEGPGCWRHQETWGCAGLQGLRERWGLGTGPVGFCPASPQQRGRNPVPAAHFGTSPEPRAISLFLPFSGMESGDGKPSGRNVPLVERKCFLCYFKDKTSKKKSGKMHVYKRKE